MSIRSLATRRAKNTSSFDTRTCLVLNSNLISRQCTRCPREPSLLLAHSTTHLTQPKLTNHPIDHRSHPSGVQSTSSIHFTDTSRRSFSIAPMKKILTKTFPDRRDHEWVRASGHSRASFRSYQFRRIHTDCKER